MTKKIGQLPGKCFWPLLVLFLSCEISINHNYHIDSQSVDHSRAREILGVINSRHVWGEGPPLPIDYFGRYAIIRGSPTWNCVDFAFSFVGLYGWPAQVAMSITHAFVVIGPYIIEPNNPQWYTIRDVTKHRLDLREKSYERIRILDRISTENIEIVINHFRNQN